MRMYKQKQLRKMCFILKLLTSFVFPPEPSKNGREKKMKEFKGTFFPGGFFLKP